MTTSELEKNAFKLYLACIVRTHSFIVLDLLTRPQSIYFATKLITVMNRAVQSKRLIVVTLMKPLSFLSFSTELNLNRGLSLMQWISRITIETYYNRLVMRHLRELSRRLIRPKLHFRGSLISEMTTL